MEDTMEVRLISENARKGTAQVVVVYKGQSVTRHLQRVGRTDSYTDKAGGQFIRTGGNRFSIEK